MSATWEDSAQYPNNRGCSCCNLYDRSFYQQRLVQSSKRLFSSEEPHIEVIARNDSKGKQSGITATKVTDVPTLQRVLAHQNQYTVVILRQNHTWSPLRSNLELMTGLLSQLDVFPPFLDLIHAFGYRSDDVGDDFQGYYHASRDVSVGESRTIQETCFNIRYPERNGRPTGNPWSIRHTAVYHQYQSLGNRHMWIVVQPSEGYHAQICSILGRSCSDLRAEGVLSPACFLSTGRYWRDYIVYLQKRASILEHKALFSKASGAAKHDFEVSFQNSQDLQRLRSRVLQVQLLVDSSVAAVQGYMTAYNGHGCYQDALKSHLFQLHSHARTATKVLQQLDGLFHELLEILKSRNDEFIRTTSDAIYQNGREISKLTSASSLQSDAIAGLTRKAQRDSHIVKIFSIVAFLYLPATLVASVFNSGLVNNVPVGSMSEMQSGTSFQLASQFWMFPVVTAALTCFSLLLTMPWLLRRNGSKTPLSQALI